MERHSLHRLGVPVQTQQLPARLHRPQPDGATLTAADQPCAIWAKGELRNARGVRLDHLKGFELVLPGEPVETDDATPAQPDDRAGVLGAYMMTG